jgi:hypothetical protein
MSTPRGTQNPRRKSGCERVLDLLSDGRWHPTYDLQVGLGVMCHSRIAELRSRGHLIEKRRTDGHGLHAYEYRLASTPGAATEPQADDPPVSTPPLPATQVSSVAAPDADPDDAGLTASTRAASDYEQLVLG